MTKELVEATKQLIVWLPGKHRKRGTAASAGAAVGATVGSVAGGPVGAAVGGAVGAAIAVWLDE